MAQYVKVLPTDAPIESIYVDREHLSLLVDLAANIFFFLRFVVHHVPSKYPEDYYDSLRDFEKIKDPMLNESNCRRIIE